MDIDSEGPHAIVAGTTGSGKSVLLQCWCLALAVTYPPDRLGFVFLDFKGGSALDRLAALPHVRGCVNDLDLSYASRALRALECERYTSATGCTGTTHDCRRRIPYAQ